MRCATDVGGTFTDLVVEDSDGTFRLYKSLTISEDPFEGVMNAVVLAAEDFDLDTRAFLAGITSFTHSTTRALNAILTGTTARTALLSTEGHPDILLFREGGRTGLFDYSVAYPDPFVPRSLTFEIDERIRANGDVLRALNKQQVEAVLTSLGEQNVEAVAVCLLWSIVNPCHELEIGKLLEKTLPGIPYTLSHQLNPIIREYRRTSSTCIDAALKPLMTEYLSGFSDRLNAAGFDGRLLGVTSKGGLIEIADLAAAPIHALNSGPSLAPVAGRFFCAAEDMNDTAIVVDTGGTSFDVSLVRDGQIPMTDEVWLGPKYTGNLTGFPAVDVKWEGAGGGSIASVDSGGLLHVGPESAGSDPGPACYGKGGASPTITDAAVLLGYLDPDFYLGGRMPLDKSASIVAIETIALAMSMSVEEAAYSILELATEHMVQSVEEITVNQGINPANCILVAGGGASGLNAISIARRLSISKVIFPFAGAVLSAYGALVSDLTVEFKKNLFTSDRNFDFAGVKRTLNELIDECNNFFAQSSLQSLGDSIELSAEAHYAEQIWNIELRLSGQLLSEQDLAAAIEQFHRQHQDLYAVHDPNSAIEFVSWIARARRKVKETGRIDKKVADKIENNVLYRKMYVSGRGMVDAEAYRDTSVPMRNELVGPLIVESEFTTIVVPPGTNIRRSATGNLIASLSYGGAQ